MNTLKLPGDLIDFASVLISSGKQAYLVGGAVRDMLLGSPVGDYDIATDARPDEVIKLFRRVIPTGIKHGTVTVLWNKHSIETTTFRSESEYSDGRHPDSIAFGTSIEEDLNRRDFTINAIACEIPGGRLIDLHDGRADIQKRIIRTVGNPGDRFNEDGLRPLRAIRFASRLAFDIDHGTLSAIRPAIPKFRMVSIERVREEMEKILLSPRPSVGLRLLEDTGLLAEIIPELARTRGVEQKGMHSFDVADHSFLACDGAPPRLILRLAALLHDIGKPDSKKIGDDGIPTFYRHEEISAAMAESLLKRMKFPNAVIDECLHLIAHHMFNYDETWTDAAVRRFLARVGSANIENLFALRLADSYASGGIRPDPRMLEPFRIRIQKTIAEAEALSVKDLAIGGDDLATLGIPRGPTMGLILKELLETVLDDPSLNEPARLLEIATRLRGKYGV